MEANDDDSCRVVYYCPKSDADICELFQASQPPVITSGDRASRPALFNVYQNVRKLLDEDVGNFETGAQATLTDEPLDVADTPSQFL